MQLTQQPRTRIEAVVAYVAYAAYFALSNATVQFSDTVNDRRVIIRDKQTDDGRQLIPKGRPLKKLTD